MPPAAASTAPALDFATKPEAVAAIVEATRLSYGHLSNPAFAAEISSIDPLPHQRIAVYEHMLGQAPLRFLLADDAGAGVLVATGAAGEGINLQFCWLMVNYDVPWNPARLEQRMGRIHRYGQRRDPVVIVNLVAGETREGRVLTVLLRKLEAIRAQLRSDKVFDVVGRLFDNMPLKGYLELAATEAGARSAIEQLDSRLTPDSWRPPAP